MQIASSSADSVVEYELCSLASSNETADNLPGPGRLLGNLYEGIGRRLENGLGRVAVRMGLNPHIMAMSNQGITSARLHSRSQYIDLVSTEVDLSSLN